jgi:hypothetical protein
VWNINKPFQGDITVEECDAEIRSIEIQLIRVESYSTSSDKFSKECKLQSIFMMDLLINTDDILLLP